MILYIKLRGGGNSKLHKAKAAKNDEFYTQFDDIAAELQYYWQHFEGKTVYCNCDDPYESNFCKYFILKFNSLKIKRLITTSYVKSAIQNKELSLYDYEPESEKTTRKPHKIDITYVPEWVKTLDDVKKFLKDEKLVVKLNGSGDFASPECAELLKQSDIVCTNPPFSLFRDYVLQLIEYKKNFIIIGNKTSIGCQEIFNLVIKNKIWLGYNPKVKEFRVPDHYEGKLISKGSDGIKYAKNIGNVCWYTNLDHKKRHEKIDLVLKYSPEKYPKYYNYDGIDVDNIAEIPFDYDGFMGVPVSIMDKYNPEQFEIIGRGADVPKTIIHKTDGDKINFIDSKTNKIVYSVPYTVSERKAGNSLRIDDNGKPGAIPFTRIIIKRK